MGYFETYNYNHKLLRIVIREKKSLSEHNEVYWHDKKPEGMSVMETRTAASQAEVYISSVNGISEAGEIVNIDNTGNRVAAISYGPEKSIFSHRL